MRLKSRIVHNLTYERLHELLEYNSENGLLLWIKQSDKRHHRGWFRGHLYQTGYLYIRIDGKQYPVHRLAWFYTYGEWPIEIDHISHDTIDNRICNLRNVTRTQNQWNSRRNRLKARGVYQRSDKYRPSITIDSSLIHLGTYDTFDEAKLVYDFVATVVQGVYRYTPEQDVTFPRRPLHEVLSE